VTQRPEATGEVATDVASADDADFHLLLLFGRFAERRSHVSGFQLV
jgi:hypothetical protein